MKLKYSLPGVKTGIRNFQRLIGAMKQKPPRETWNDLLDAALLGLLAVSVAVCQKFKSLRQAAGIRLKKWKGGFGAKLKNFFARLKLIATKWAALGGFPLLSGVLSGSKAERGKRGEAKREIVKCRSCQKPLFLGNCVKVAFNEGQHLTDAGFWRITALCSHGNCEMGGIERGYVVSEEIGRAVEVYLSRRENGV